MIRADLFRFQSDMFQTLGTLTFWDKTIMEYKCSTLELGWKNNEKMISCIQEGTYKAVKRYSEKFGWHWHLVDVPDRSLILIHKGNYYTDVNGCILVGQRHEDLNKDGLSDVIGSTKTMQEINELLGNQNEFQIRVYS